MVPGTWQKAYWDVVAGLYDFSVSRRTYWLRRQLVMAEGLSGKILEACCGPGRLTCELLRQGLDVWAIDYSSRMVALARRRLNEAGFSSDRVRVADVGALPFADGEFDYAAISGGLWLVPDQEQALGELLRVCRREVRLLEPFDREEGYYPGNTVAWLLGGFRPLSRTLLDRLSLKKRVRWQREATMLGGLVSYLRVTHCSPGGRRCDTLGTRGEGTMRHEAELWARDALYDLDCARDMLEKRRHNYAVWFSRQAAEKMLKAGYLLLLKEPIPKEHNLLALSQTLLGEEAAVLRSDLSFLNPHYTTTRYVDAAVGAPADLYDEEAAQEAYRRSAEVIAWLTEKLGLADQTGPA